MELSRLLRYRSQPNTPEGLGQIRDFVFARYGWPHFASKILLRAVVEGAVGEEG